jgi:hypothetical protein
MQNLKEKDYLKNEEVERRAIFNPSKRKRCKFVDWIHLASDRCQRRALVKMAISLSVTVKES